VALGGMKGVRDEKTRQYTNLESLDIEKYYLWRDLASEPYKKDSWISKVVFIISATKRLAVFSPRKRENTTRG